MVNAGRILIIAKGEWSNLVNYEQLDLVSYNQVAYLARQASVGVNPSTDSSMTYWQPFGSVSDIATTTTPGLVMPDGTTITIDNTGLIQANVGISDIKDVDITNLATGDVIRYNATSQKWENVSISSIQTTVEQIIAPVEDSTTTSQSYSVGESFIRNNVLYRAKLPISQGTSWSSLVLNTDYEAAPSVSAQNQTLVNKVGTVTSKTLAANATSVQFDVPTSGDYVIDFFSSDGSNYTAIDLSVTGKATLTFEADASARTISCRVAQA